MPKQLDLSVRIHRAIKRCESQGAKDIVILLSREDFAAIMNPVLESTFGTVQYMHGRPIRISEGVPALAAWYPWYDGMRSEIVRL
jgi:hypothetical protein